MINHLIDNSFSPIGEVDVKYVSNDFNTLAMLVGSEGILLATGRARRKPGDLNSVAIGKLISLGRAFIELGNEYLGLAAVLLDVANNMERE